jgi:hypothetical protein
MPMIVVEQLISPRHPMNASLAFCLCAALVTPLVAAPKFHAEVGASAFLLRQRGALEPGPAPLTVDSPTKFSPFVAGTFAFWERFGLRLSYHHLNDVETTAEFGSPPGIPPSPLPIVVWGHYRDDVHLFSLMPEYTWNLARGLKLGIAPQLNWVASEGVIRYSTNNALILLMAPRQRDDHGFTLGGGARLLWALGARATLSLGYHHSDLGPSFHRRAHVLSAGFAWKF